MLVAACGGLSIGIGVNLLVAIIGPAEPIGWWLIHYEMILVRGGKGERSEVGGERKVNVSQEGEKKKEKGGSGRVKAKSWGWRGAKDNVLRVIFPHVGAASGI